MEAVLSASAREDAGGLSLPVMTIIAMLLLMLPYLIRRYSGRSVTELLRPSALLNGIDRRLEERTGIKVTVAEEPKLCVAVGTGKALDSLEFWQNDKINQRKPYI